MDIYISKITTHHDTHTIHLQGDTSDGTTLVGLNLETGTEMCRGAIPVREMGFVGFAQSLDFVSFTFCSSYIQSLTIIQTTTAILIYTNVLISPSLFYFFV